MPEMRRRWEELLQVEPAATPLGCPEAMAQLVPDSLERVFKLLLKTPRRPLSVSEARLWLPTCDCGHNPYRTYFIAGEQAVTEGFVYVEASLPPSERRPSDMAEVIYAIRRLARAEIETFCGACVHRGKADQCRHRFAAGANGRARRVTAEV